MLVVDTYNVLHTTGVLPPELAGLETDDLLRLIARSRYARREVRLICDGLPAATPGIDTRDDGRAIRRLGWAEVWYSGHAAQADDLIEQELLTASAARTWLVVSSDRRIRRAAARAGSRLLLSEVFLKQLVDDELKPSAPRLPAFATDIPLDRYSLAHWLREFGYDPSEYLLRPPANSAQSDASPSLSALLLPPPLPRPKSKLKAPRLRPAAPPASLSGKIEGLDQLRLGPSAPPPASQSSSSHTHPTPSHSSAPHAAPSGPGSLIARAGQSFSPSASAPPPRSSAPPPSDPVASNFVPSASDAGPSRPERPPWLQAAAAHWADRFDPAELDMQRWLDSHPPSASPPRSPPSPP